MNISMGALCQNKNLVRVVNNLIDIIATSLPNKDNFRLIKKIQNDQCELASTHHGQSHAQWYQSEAGGTTVRRTSVNLLTNTKHHLTHL